jgi:hypothetical protein
MAAPGDDPEHEPRPAKADHHEVLEAVPIVQEEDK